MTKSVTVNFEDGTNHTYDDVPDEISNDQIQQRAQSDFPDQKIENFAHNAPGTAPAAPAKTEQVPPAAAALGYGTAAFHAANDFLQTPVAHVVEGGALAKYGLNKLNDIAANYGAAKNIPASMPAPAPAPVTPEIKPINLPSGHPMNAGFAPGSNPMPATPGVTPAGGAPAQQGTSFLENIAQKYGQIANRVAPSLSSIANSPLGRVAGGAMRIAGSAPVMGAQLMAHSGGLNTNEDQLLADKHRLEAQMLLNKHAAEWNKYKNATQAQ